MLFTLLSLAAVLQDPSPAPTPKPTPPRKVCREAPDLGTRVARPKVCKTPDQWNAQSARLQHHLRQDDLNTQAGATMEPPR